MDEIVKVVAKWLEVDEAWIEHVVGLRLKGQTCKCEHGYGYDFEDIYCEDYQKTLPKEEPVVVYNESYEKWKAKYGAEVLARQQELQALDRRGLLP